MKKRQYITQGVIMRVPDVPSLSAYLATAVHVNLANFMLQNLEAAARIAKSIKEMEERRIQHLVQAETSRVLIQERDRLKRVMSVAEITPETAAGD